jgi:pimeloyl-ACP methyl ester carboxylesterase
MNQLPIVYVRGYAGPTSGIDATVDDPFYGFNEGATHVRVDGDGDPMFYQFEGPLLRLVTEQNYRFLVHGDQRRFLETSPGGLEQASIWVHRFYDKAATTYTARPKRNVLEVLRDGLLEKVTSEGYDLEEAAADLYDLVMLIRDRTGAPAVNLVAHSMGGLIVRCMIQKVCQTPDDTGERRAPARDIVAKVFTFGTPHGGIETVSSIANWAMDTFGPAGSDIFSPRKMYGYLTPGRRFGDDGDDGWDPQVIPPEVFDVDNVFCLIGTNPNDYGAQRLAVGAKSDGLVLIENAYVRGAHRAYVHKSHSGRYGEVNSEEGYQNLRRFLFGRWAVSLAFSDLPHADVLKPGISWQADMRLAIRGLPILMSQQLAAHWCPIQLNDELLRHPDSPDSPVPLVSTFLLQKEPPRPTQSRATPAGIHSRYVLTLRVTKLVSSGGTFDFTDHLEQVFDWSDSLIVDVGDNPASDGLEAYTGWNSTVPGAIDSYARMPAPLELSPVGDVFHGFVDLPESARALPVLGDRSRLRITVKDRDARV